MGQLFADAARAYLSAGINNTDTTISIAAGGALFPVANGTDWFKAVLQDANGIEIVYVTAHTSASTSFTVTRGQEGTTARSFASGAVFGVRVTSADMAGFAAKLSDAPSDGKIYGRKDAAWAEVVTGGVTSVNGTAGAVRLKTINGTNLLGSGDIVISGGGGGGGSEDTTTSFTYTYTGVMGMPPIPLPGSGSLLASPAGNERAFNVLFVGPANPELTGIEFTKLEFVGGTFSPSNMAALTSLSLPALTTVGGSFGPYGMNALTSLSVPALTTVGGSFGPYSLTALTSLSLPVIERIGTTISSGNAIQLNSSTAALTTFELPASLKQVGGTAGNVTITSAALNQASVDSILVRLAALDGTSGTVAFSNRTVTITGTSSAPSSAGLAAKTTLVERGCTVTHN